MSIESDSYITSHPASLSRERVIERLEKLTMKQATRRSLRIQLSIGMLTLLMGLVTVFGYHTSVYAAGYGTLVFDGGKGVLSAQVNGTCLNDDRNFVSNLTPNETVTAYPFIDSHCTLGSRTYSIQTKTKAGRVQHFGW